MSHQLLMWMTSKMALSDESHTPHADHLQWNASPLSSSQEEMASFLLHTSVLIRTVLAVCFDSAFHTFSGFPCFKSCF